MRTPLRILHLEDDPLDAELIQATLAAEDVDCEIIWVDSRVDFLRALEQEPLDLILADHSLPTFDGVSALALKNEKRPKVPFIFVSGALGEEKAIEMLKSGATDYVLKTRLARLAPAVRRALREAEAEAERKQAEEALSLSRHQLEVILEGVTDGVLALNPQGQYVYVNDTAAYIFGYASTPAMLEATIEDALNHVEIFNETGQPLPFDQFPGHLALQGQHPAPVTVCFRLRSTGQARWATIEAAPVFNVDGQVELAVVVFHDITDFKRVELEQRLLADAGRALESSLDYRVRLENLSKITVPALADWCVVDMAESDGSLQRLVSIHVNPVKAAFVEERHRRYPLSADSPQGAPHVLRSGQSELYAEVSDEAFVKQAEGQADHLRLLRAIGLRSMMVVPLITRGRILGVISFGITESRRRYNPSDLALAEELARRAALAVDNARLFDESQTLNVELEQRVTQRTIQLVRANVTLEREVAERKRTEERFRGLVEGAPDAIVIVDQAGQIMLVNSQTEALFGYRRGELLGKPVEVLIPGGLRDQHVGHRMTYLQRPTTRPMGAGLDLYGLHKDGRQFPVEISLSPLEHAEGLLISAAIRDITERKQAEQRLRDSREQLRALSARLQSAREEERARIAREIHDEFGQLLTAFKMDVAWLQKHLATTQIDKLQEKTQAMQELIDTTVRTVRQIAAELRPGILDDLGLAAAVEWQLREFQSRTGIRCKLISEVEDANLGLDPESATAVFRILQETLTNVMRHAQATRVGVTLQQKDSYLQLRVRDNGRGITEAEISSGKSFGLLGMRERALLRAGELHISGKPGQGTTLTLRMPLTKGESP